ncbi:MAG: hypothetical protein R3F46_00635 [bacterium]
MNPGASPGQAPFAELFPMGAAVAILEILAIPLAWCLIRLGWMAYKLWIDRMHELEMPRMLKRMQDAGLYNPPEQK